MAKQVRSGHLACGLALTCAMALLVAACAGAHERTADSPTTLGHSRPPDTPTTTASTPAQAVLAANQRLWKVWLEANDPPNPDDPQLSAVAVDPLLSGTRQSIEQHLQRGERVTLPKEPLYRHDATATLNPSNSSAEVQDCATDDSIVEDAATGKVIDGSVETQLIEAQMVLTPSGWRASRTTFVKSWPGVVAC